MFGQTPEKSWYFANSVHSEAVNRLMYVVEQGESFVLLQGPHGSGKSSVLEQVQSECARSGHSAALLNVAALDQSAFLWCLCGTLSIIPEKGQSMSGLMSAIRDELIGRSVCRHRTVVLLDDVSRACADLASVIDFLIGISQQTDGTLSVLAATEDIVVPVLQRRSALKVVLSGLDERSAAEFIQKCLKALRIDRSSINPGAVRFMVQSAEGNPARLARLCELVSVACQTTPGIMIDAGVLESLATETLFARAS